MLSVGHKLYEFAKFFLLHDFMLHFDDEIRTQYLVLTAFTSRKILLSELSFFPPLSIPANKVTTCARKSELKSLISLDFRNDHHHHHHHHHKHQGLDPLIRSVSRVTAARANASSVFQLFSFLVVCSGMISNGFGFVAFFASVKASSVCIHLSCLVCL